MPAPAEPDWTFGGEWPFRPCWFDSADGRMHYIDERPSSGAPVVLVHGNPTWGFVYRKFVGPLAAAGHRVVVPDHLGFGRSDMPRDTAVCTLASHIRRFDALLESLDLRGATVVPQDWGGPIGLSWAAAHPDRVDRLFVLNTFAHRPPWPVPIPLPLRLFRAPGTGEVLVKGMNMFVRGFLFRAGVTHPERLTPQVRRAYLAPHPDWASRTAMLAFPRAIPSGPDGPVSDLAAVIEVGLRRYFADRPVAIAWGMKDPAFTPRWLELWLDTFPRADVMRLPDAGHYLQEDAHERIIPALLRFVGSNG
ncbi:MAG: alpha/beta fold hydrolase [Streptosporangiaceae bacterium]